MEFKSESKSKEGYLYMCCFLIFELYKSTVLKGGVTGVVSAIST